MKNIFLLRDNRQDTGQGSSSGPDFASPDLIIHEQVSDPESFFTTNYDEDVCQELNTQSKINLIYVRAKNLTNNTVNGFVRLYAAEASLFLEPTQWEKNKLTTADGNSVIPIGPIPPNGIGVCKIPFVFNAERDKNYCHVGIISETKNEIEIPNSFEGFSEYVDWLHANSHIAMRNYTLVNKRAAFLETVTNFLNPYNTNYKAEFHISLTKSFPIGCIISFQCEQLQKSKIFHIENKGQTLFIVEVELLPLLQGVASVKLELPQGAIGPVGGGLSLSCKIRKTVSTQNTKRLMSMDNEDQSFIKIGECTVSFPNS